MVNPADRDPLSLDGEGWGEGDHDYVGAGFEPALSL